jgi:hypothetical protein
LMASGLAVVTKARSVITADRRQYWEVEFVTYTDLEEVDGLLDADILGIDDGDRRERYGCCCEINVVQRTADRGHSRIS